MMNRKKSLLFIGIAVYALFAIFFYSPSRLGVEDAKSIAGTWEGKFTWLDKSKSFPISIIFRKDGSYQFDSVLNRTTGKMEIEKGKVTLTIAGERGATFTLHKEKGKQILKGKNPGFGTYRLGRVK
jgi:hypothetical protein